MSKAQIAKILNKDEDTIRNYIRELIKENALKKIIQLSKENKKLNYIKLYLNKPILCIYFFKIINIEICIHFLVLIN